MCAGIITEKYPGLGGPMLYLQRLAILHEIPHTIRCNTMSCFMCFHLSDFIGCTVWSHVLSERSVHNRISVMRRYRRIIHFVLITKYKNPVQTSSIFLKQQELFKIFSPQICIYIALHVNTYFKHVILTIYLTM